MSRSPPRYTRQDSEQTLREGLAEYYRLNPNLLNPEDMPAEAAILFRRHDVTHVVFGCDTSLRGETLVDTWTILGTTAGLSGYLQYFKYPQVNAIFADVGALRIAVEFLRGLPDVVRVAFRAVRLSPKWPWAEYDRFVDTTLDQIRRAYKIRLVRVGT
jgi:hypothetical protein